MSTWGAYRSNRRLRWRRDAAADATALAGVLWVLISCTAVTAHAQPSGSLPPLAAEHREVLATIRPDPPPRKLLNDQHYVVSDEQYPERFRTTLLGRGGALLGVGTDQNYFFAGWARPELVIVVDFDQSVVDLHTAYRAFFREASDADRFIELWSDEGRARASAAVAKETRTDDERRRVEGALRISRHLVHGRLRYLRDRFAGRGVQTFLTDPAEYRYVAALATSGRVVAVRGDFTADLAMQSAARATRALGLTVRAFYLSNVEQYIRYTPRFRENVLGLPVDDSSVVLRTYHRGGKRGYVYAVQSAAHFRQWMGRPSATNLGDLMWSGRASWSNKLIRLGAPPPSP